MGKKIENASGQNKNSKNQIKILIIDHDLSTSDILVKTLEKTHVDFVIKQEINPELGLNTAKDWIPDLILTEIKFPGNSSNAFLSKFQKDKRTENIFTVYLTGETNRKTILKAIEKNPNDILYKPINTEILEFELFSWIEKIKIKKKGTTIHFQDGFLRKYSRLAFSSNINYRPATSRNKEDFYQAITEDVSNEGLSIKLIDIPENLRKKMTQIGTIIDFHLLIPGENKRSENLKGEVKNIKTQEEAGQKVDIIGIYFIDVPNEIRAKLIHAAHSKLQKKIKQKIIFTSTAILFFALIAFTSVMVYSKKKVEKKLSLSETQRVQLTEEKNSLFNDIEKLRKMKNFLSKQTKDMNYEMKNLMEREKKLDRMIQKKEKQIREMEGMVKELTDQWLKYLDREKKKKTEDERY